MSTNTKVAQIQKEAFTSAREKLGLSTKELGLKACLSTRQIEQIENGEMSSFYGAQVKYTAAKKVASLLGLNEQDAFEGNIPSAVEVAPQKLEAPDKERVNASPSKISDDLAPTKTKLVPRKLFIGLSLFAVIVFSVINLRPLFFTDAPDKGIVITEEVIEVAPATTTVATDPVPVPAPSVVVVEPTTAPVAPAAVALLTTTDVSLACPAEEGILSYKPEAPRKSADMVYVQAKTKQTVCVVDASGKIQNKLLEPGAGTSFYGRPPFKVLTLGMTQADVYFQGAKVRLTNPNVKTLILEATEVATMIPAQN
ncbi:helix-turn-helix domain-containing protein [Polynucleobacter brandtiae]|uniref:Helix-turn-helix protein n=1 Tax=Polynucleobacter brandtiae TaxID=1938816 RepID=A0A2M8VQW7_9BURK|nr:helix-turn-helix transcriptional regulator [Polynucleobacter brandtiae]PJI79837.1 helix-turn-helix protein [Polynucleobacter brandtiae]